MLMNSQGKQVRVAPHVRGHDSKGRPDRNGIAILAPLRELHVPSTGHKDRGLFKLETRAKVKQ